VFGISQPAPKSKSTPKYPHDLIALSFYFVETKALCITMSKDIKLSKVG